jgi:hypothetical protein
MRSAAQTTRWRVVWGQIAPFIAVPGGGGAYLTRRFFQLA